MIAVPLQLTVFIISFCQLSAYSFVLRNRIRYTGCFCNSESSFDNESSKQLGVLNNLRPPQKISPESILLSNAAILNVVAVLWGSQHLIIKSAVNGYPAASLVNFSRFLVSLCFFIPSVYDTIKTKNILTIKSGLELGLYSFLGFAFQAIGLQYTSASRSAFLLYLNIKFVPILALLLYNRKVSSVTWISAALALLGTLLLSTDNGPMNIGDGWSILAALASAMFILRLDAFVNEDSSQINPAELNGITSAATTALCGVWMLSDLHTASIGSGLSMPVLASNWLQILLENPFPPLYLGLVITGLCGYLQVSFEF